MSAVILLPDGNKFGEHPHVKTFLKGVFNLRPPKPRYEEIWDSDIVLEFLKEWSPKDKITLKQLAFKVVVLLLLVTGQRAQIITTLNIEDMKISDECYSFTISNAQLKQGRPGYKPEKIELRTFNEDRRICIYSYLKEYLFRTEELRNEIKEVFITIKKPHRKVSRDTVSRWIKTVLRLSGINVGQFKPGSTRAAAVSKAKSTGANIEEILRAGGWSRQSTFAKFYKKPIKKVNKGLAEFVMPYTNVCNKE